MNNKQIVELKRNLDIVFFGTPEFAVESLDRIVKAGYNVKAVVTMPDKIAGRGHKLIQSDVKKYAVAHNLRLLQPESLKNKDFLEELRSLNANLFIVIAFRMLPREVWDMPELGTFNLHASLLPDYRGAAPINRAIMNGEKVTGVTTFFLKHEIDTGDIIDQCEIEVGEDENVGSVHDRLMRLGADLLLQTLKKLEEGNVETRRQPDGSFTPAPKIFKDDCEIEWSKDETSVHNHIRGLSPYPCAWTVIQDATGKETEVKILESKLNPCEKELTSGEIYCDKTRMFIGTANRPVEILRLQPAGKKAMETNAFLRGYHPARAISHSK